MSPRKLVVYALFFFCAMGCVGGFKKWKAAHEKTDLAVIPDSCLEAIDPSCETVAITPLKVSEERFDSVDRIRLFFTKGTDKFPIVQTLSYTSYVPWLKGRAAWLADYARHFSTSKHFISRSLSGNKIDYFSQKIALGDQFNVLRTDVNFNFYLLVDLSRLSLFFYYQDFDRMERVLVKTYPIGAGRLDSSLSSGSLTPVGVYKLGSKCCVYRSGQTGFFHNEKCEMIQIFGTRWIPFAEAVGEHTEAPKGYGIHGLPAVFDPTLDQIVEKKELLGCYESDGCIRLCKDDIEELFSIIVSRETVVEIVKRVDDLQGALTLVTKMEPS